MAQVKISKAQQMVLDDAKKDIDFARAYETFEEWLRADYARRGDKDYYINKLGYTEKNIMIWLLNGSRERNGKENIMKQIRLVVLW